MRRFAIEPESRSELLPSRLSILSYDIHMFGLDFYIVLLSETDSDKTVHSFILRIINVFKNTNRKPKSSLRKNPSSACCGEAWT
jgi:hypothetical protein